MNTICSYGTTKVLIFNVCHKYFRVNDLGLVSPGELADSSRSSSSHSALNNWHPPPTSISKILLKVTARRETVFSDQCVLDFITRVGRRESQGEGLADTVPVRVSSSLGRTKDKKAGKGIPISHRPYPSRLQMHRSRPCVSRGTYPRGPGGQNRAVSGKNCCKTL